MNRKEEILSILFLLVYFSFLFHDLLGHHHHHTTADIQHHQNELINQDKQEHDSSCSHLLENCNSCSNDDKMHKLVFLTQDHKSNPLFIIPSVRIPVADDQNSEEKIYITDDKSVKIFCPLTRFLRGPPSLA